MAFDPDTAIGGQADRFPLTRLSLIESARASDGLRNDALEQVVSLYWKPVYHYVRLKWNTRNEEAKDLTQGFFTSALERDFFKRFDPQQASFRTYVRMAVDRFAANEYASARREKRGGKVSFVPLDFDAADAEFAAMRVPDSPEDIFQREWQRQLFALAIDDLRLYCDQAGKQVQFRIFQEYDLAAGDRPAYARLAEQAGVPVTTVNNYLAWARRMLRGFVLDRLRRVTSGDAELRDEMRSVFSRER